MTETHALYALLGALVLVVVWYLWRWVTIERSRPTTGERRPRVIDAVMSLVINFFDTLGIGSFAPTTAIFKLQKRMPDEQIPGTLNVGYTLPTLAQALIYTVLIKVELLTLVSMIAAAVLGSWLGAGVVARLPRRGIQIGLGSVLLIAAIIFFSKGMGWSPPGGTTLGLTGGLFVAGIVGNFILGALMTIGLGLYGPCLILVSLLGMNPQGAFPIMMGSCAFLMPICSVRFIRLGKYNLRTAIGLAIGAIPGVLIAAYLVTQLDIKYLYWLVMIVALYASLLMLNSARKGAPLAEKATVS